MLPCGSAFKPRNFNLLKSAKIVARLPEMGVCGDCIAGFADGMPFLE